MHPVPRHDVADRERLGVAHVQVPARVGEHVQHVGARPDIGRVARRAERPGLRPAGQPLVLDVTRVVLRAGLQRCRRLSSFPHGFSILRRRTASHPFVRPCQDGAPKMVLQTQCSNTVLQTQCCKHGAANKSAPRSRGAAAPTAAGPTRLGKEQPTGTHGVRVAHDVSCQYTNRSPDGRAPRPSACLAACLNDP